MSAVCEASVRDIGAAALARFCSDVQIEYRIPGHRLRVDLRATLPNGHWALVECKPFDQTVTPYVDAVDQAASYADAIEYPVFIGPVYGSPLELSLGRHDNGLGTLHLMAGRLNVGFLWINERDEAGLLLRGQNIIDTRRGLHSNFDNVWRYKRRSGSGVR